MGFIVMRSRCVLAGLLLAQLAPLGAQDSAQQPQQPVLEEHVEILLVETVVRVSDRRGDPVLGLTRDLVEVAEGGDPRRVAYFEPFLSAARESQPEPATSTATLYDPSGQVVAAAPVQMLPPQPARRIVIAFDIANSKVRSRELWRAAALEWVGAHMTPADRVGVVVLRNVPEWIQPMANNPGVVRGALESVNLEGRASPRDRRSEITSLYEEMSACAQTAEAGGRRTGSGSANPGQSTASVHGSSDEIDCAYSLAEPWIAQWNAESLESIAAVGMLSGALAAIPGRKEVLLFSEGIIPDAGSLATDTMLAVFGTDRMNYSAMGSTLRRNAMAEITKLHDAARAAGIVYFTFDTRTGAERGHHDMLGVERPVSERSVGANPWTEMYASTNSTLAALAEETGGDTYRGTDDLGKKVSRAAESYSGTYALGFYRPPGVNKPGKLRVKINRNGIDLTYSQKTFRPPKPARATQLDLSIRNPEPSEFGDRQRLPVLLDLKVPELPFRNADGTWGCQLTYFIQATRPDGTVVTEAFENVTIAMGESPKEGEQETVYRQMVRLDLPTGPVRLLARVSDDRQVIIAERTIDLTVASGEVRGGIVVADSPESP